MKSLKKNCSFIFCTLFVLPGFELSASSPCQEAQAQFGRTVRTAGFMQDGKAHSRQQVLSIAEEKFKAEILKSNTKKGEEEFAESFEYFRELTGNSSNASILRLIDLEFKKGLSKEEIGQELSALKLELEEATSAIDQPQLRIIPSSTYKSFEVNWESAVEFYEHRKVLEKISVSDFVTWGYQQLGAKKMLELDLVLDAFARQKDKLDPRLEMSQFQEKLLKIQSSVSIEARRMGVVARNKEDLSVEQIKPDLIESLILSRVIAIPNSVRNVEELNAAVTKVLQKLEDQGRRYQIDRVVDLFSDLFVEIGQAQETPSLIIDPRRLNQQAYQQYSDYFRFSNIQ